jgi:hypothetical protein
MSVSELKESLDAIFRPRKPGLKINPPTNQSARDLMGDASSLFEPVIKTQPRNQASITSGDLRGILDAVAEMERRIKEMEPEQKEIGYFDSIFMGFSHPAFPGCIKIGKSIGPSRRPEQWKTGVPHGEFREEFRIWVNDYSRVELEVHSLLDQHRKPRQSVQPLRRAARKVGGQVQGSNPQPDAATSAGDAAGHDRGDKSDHPRLGELLPEGECQKAVPSAGRVDRASAVVLHQ